MGKILLFYKYIAIQYPGTIVKWQKKLCEGLSLKGRILIGIEGINGTVGGTDEATQAYIEAMRQHELFADIDFKFSEGGAEYFPKLYVVERPEIVALGIDPKDLTPEQAGKHLEPEEVHRLLENKPKDLVILDARNNYESRIGTFTDAITPDIKNFRDFPEYIDNNLEQFKDKEVLMFCTGGIRCERATAYLNTKGIAKTVYQLNGGIHRYVEKYPEGFFRGKNYVFDARIAVKINDDILGACYICSTPNDEYTNCVNASCNLQFISCPACVVAFKETCGSTCLALVEENKVVVRTKQARIDAHDQQQSPS